MTGHLNDRVVMGEGVEVVVEDSLADDVQRQPREEVLHLHALPGLRSSRRPSASTTSPSCYYLPGALSRIAPAEPFR